MLVRPCGSRSIGNEASCLSQRRGPSGRRGIPGLSVGQARGPPGSRGHDAVLHRALRQPGRFAHRGGSVSYTHLRAHETDSYLVCRLLLEKKKKKKKKQKI